MVVGDSPEEKMINQFIHSYSTWWTQTHMYPIKLYYSIVYNKWT